jgi:glycosyltransferase involved in cell wall biosynthesis
MTRLLPVSAIVMTRNEAANIEACLAGLHECGQTLVVDSSSQDGTADIARAMGAEVIDFSWNGAYPKKKQWCLQWPGIRYEWTLFVDADERVAPELMAELRTLMAAGGPSSDMAAYFIASRPLWLGRTLRHGVAYRKIALMHRRRVRFLPVNDLAVASMWEVEGHYQPHVDGRIGHLRHGFVHADAKPPFAWFERHNRYSDWEAEIAGVHADMIGYRTEPTWLRRELKWALQRAPARPLLDFLYGYVFRLGFLDGRAGWHHAVARAFYYWQINYKRAWLRCQPLAVGSARDASPSPLAIPPDRPTGTLEGAGLESVSR